MKRFLLTSLFMFSLVLTGCGGSSPVEDDEEFNSTSIPHVTHVGEIGSFKLTSPDNDFSTNTGFTFTWEEATNADYYVLEIASTINFIKDDEDEVYVKESNLSINKYDLNFVLPKKDIIYYWQVSAINANKTQKCDEIGHFTYESIKIDEINIEIEDEQDWAVHKEGSQAEVSIDRNNFFGNNQNSLVIKFDMEHTKQDIPSSDGWIVITKTQDTELYGTDAFYLKFYYSGHDSTVLIRVLDYDGEYWHNQVQISRNSKQTVLMKYEDFQLRTAGTNVYNRVFDWQHIRYFEIVFERTFGDGVCILSDIKAVNFEDYKYMFMDKMDFSMTDPNTWTYENFNFDKEVSPNGDELTLSWTAKNAETNPDGFNGYGFQNVPLNKYFVQGDALRMKVKYTGCSSTAIFYFRVLEEDNDRWQFKTPFTYLIKGEYKEVIVPLKALQRMEYMNGDGAKQFYFIQRFNIGLADNYASGTLSIKDLEVIKLNDIVESRNRVVSSEGLIEDFNQYDIYTQMYYYWEQSSANVDEAMKLDTIHKTGGLANTACGEFDYKADMEMAVYQLYLDTSGVHDMNALSLWLRDASVKPDVGAVSYIADEDVAAQMTIQLTLDTGEYYRYVIPKLIKDWRQYTILFSEFEVVNKNALFDEIQPLVSDHIIHMAFGFQYFYYDINGKPYPTYAIANPVYIDEIYFKTASETTIEEISNQIKEDTDNPNRITVDNMESYANDDAIFGNWQYGYNLDYNSLAIADDVSTLGGSKSMKMHYKGSSSVSYVRPTDFASTITAKGFMVDIKSDGKATIYLNLNWRSGSTLYKMRYTLVGAPNVWTRYEIGFSFFTQDGTTKTISMNTAKDIESISFGITNSSGEASDIYVDNIALRKDLTYSTFTTTTLDVNS
ncbi:MAG: hypothetical protein K6C32_03135 [Bacilli bacterium]|nr:hypothetical protein [Bacilli bacterium]